MKFRLIYDRRLRRNFFRNEIYSIGFKFLISNYFLRTNILFFFTFPNSPEPNNRIFFMIFYLPIRRLR